MISIFFGLDLKKRVSTVLASGHSGLMPHGEDVVCAAVSTLLQAAVFSLDSLFKADIDYEIAPGEISLTVKNGEDSSACFSDSQTVLHHTLFSLMNLAYQYPDQISLHVSGMPDWQEVLLTEDDLHRLKTIFGRE